MPVHVHADEEEFFYVLGGGGLSWQDGRTYRVAANDCIVHRAGAEAHTLIASDEGLEALAFSSGSTTGMTWLPHAHAWWMGPRWLPSDGPSPFQLEAQAGELELPEPEQHPPTTILATAHVPPKPICHGAVDSERRDLGVAGDSILSGMSHVKVAPGAHNCVFHCHSAEEELFVVLAGSGTLRLGDQRHTVQAGHVVARPPGTRIAHEFIAGDNGLTLLAWGTREPNDIVWYPDSNTVNLRGIGIKGRIDPLNHSDEQR